MKIRIVLSDERNGIGFENLPPMELDVLHQTNQLHLTDKALERVSGLGSSIARPALNSPSIRTFTKPGVLPCPRLASPGPETGCDVGGLFSLR
jgi:hypothetical protein